MILKEQILEVLCRINPQIADNEDSNLLETGLIDSYEIVNVVMDLEAAFDIEIDPEYVIVDNFKTAEDIYKLVKLIRGE